ncbi:MAG: hypothetical protein Q4F54_06615 [Coriobacteriia bacterium]|nr:hypothetical protein [Coriobacteriia bacterium]
MSDSKKSENIKEKAKETTAKAKEQLDSFIEKKPIDNIKLPLAAKIFAVLCIVQCVITAPLTYNYIVDFVQSIQDESILSQTASSIVMTVLFLSCTVITIALLIAIGVNMLLNRRRIAAVLSNIAAVTIIIASFTEVMVKGLTPEIYVQVITIVLLIALKSYLDPSLSKERKQHRHERDEQNKKEQESGNLGFHSDGRPKLNFFNLFWLFCIMCVVGYL